LGLSENIPHTQTKLHAQVFLTGAIMTQAAAPALKPASAPPAASQPPSPFATRYSAELMKMLAQLVMLR
jgi:hypothetical protein